MIRKRIPAIMTAFALSIGLLLIPASPALANPFWYDAVDVTWTDTEKDCKTDDGDTYLDACVQPYGDVVWVKDNEANGKGMRVIWHDSYMNPTWSGSCTNRLGQAAGWGACDFDWVEGHAIRWWIEFEFSNGWAPVTPAFHTTV